MKNNNKCDWPTNHFQLVWTIYGGEIAIGIRNLTWHKDIIERVFNTFYNYGITGGSLHEMNEGKFGYFLTKVDKLKKVNNIKTEVGKEIKILLKTNFVREDFLKEYA